MFVQDRAIYWMQSGEVKQKKTFQLQGEIVNVKSQQVNREFF